MKSIIYALLISASSILAQNIFVDQGKWRLSGAVGDISLTKDMIKNCSLFIFDYDTQKFNKHTSDTVTSTQDIQAGKGFWAYGLNGNCEINTKQTTSTDQTTPTTKNEASYELTFKATWSKETHPADFPSNPHFSPLIGMVSSESNRLYTRGQPATPGVKLMAETGNTSIIETEIKAIDNALMIKGTPITSPGTITVKFKANLDRAYLSIVSMIAPSPDWFIGASAVSLRDESGNWITNKVIKLKLYDAGTDSGTKFTAANQPTSPAAGVTLLDEPTVNFQGGAPEVGTFTIKKLAY